MKNIITSLFILCLTLSSFAESKATRLSQYNKVDRTVVLTAVGGNLSGVTYNYDTGTYFVIQNNYEKMFEYDQTFSTLLRTIHLTGLADDDTEDLVYLGQDEFAIVAENNLVTIFKIPQDVTTVDVNKNTSGVTLVQLPPPGKKNNGLEGICFTKTLNPLGTFFAVQEMKPRALYQWDRAVNKFTEPFDVQTRLAFRMSDLSGCLFDDINKHLILLSHESSRAMEFDLEGNILKTLDLPKMVPQYEGITLGPNNELVLVSEPATVLIMKARTNR